MRVCLTGLVLISGYAFAQPPPPPPPPSGGGIETPTASETQSVLPNLLATSPGVTIDARLDFTLDGEDNDQSLLLFAVNAHAQYISPGGLGGYIAFPFVYASADGESESGMGNVELGGLYALRQAAGTDVLLRGGISIDSASQEDIFLLVYGQLSPKLLDVYTSGFATTWGRVQAQLRHASGNLRIGGSVGFDLPIDGLAEEAGFDGAISGAVSIGVQQTGVGFGIGVAVLKPLGDGDTETFMSINAIVDFPINEKMRFFGAFSYPEPDENEFEIYSVGAGIRTGM